MHRTAHILCSSIIGCNISASLRQSISFIYKPLGLPCCKANNNCRSISILNAMWLLCSAPYSKPQTEAGVSNCLLPTLNAYLYPFCGGGYVPCQRTNSLLLNNIDPWYNISFWYTLHLSPSHPGDVPNLHNTISPHDGAINTLSA